jgi:hypothetical protein
MNAGMWIFLGGFLSFLSWQLFRAMRTAKRENRRIEAMLVRLAEQRCLLCGKSYGKDIRAGIQMSFEDDDQLPTHLAAVETLSTWRVTCPHCQGVALLAENEHHFELLKLTDSDAKPASLSRTYLMILSLLVAALVGTAIYSLVRFFNK